MIEKLIKTNKNCKIYELENEAYQVVNYNTGMVELFESETKEHNYKNALFCMQLFKD